eukprot:4971393-Amphidinium_carterae.1
MPNASKSSVEGNFPVLLLTLPIKLELSVGRGRKTGSHALKVFPGAGHLRTQDLSRVPLSSERGFVPQNKTDRCKSSRRGLEPQPSLTASCGQVRDLCQA